MINEYYVGVGGSPRDTWSSFDDLEYAKGKCLEMAKEQAEYNGLDPDDIEEWGDDEDTGWGACPSDDDGGYWPCIWVKGE
jgi:hypothetical protein